MSRSTVTIETPDGRCEAHTFRPEDGAKPWPAVLFFMDGIGIREALFAMGDRMAQHGYFVLLPDLFYRAGPYTAPDPAKLFGDPELRQMWMTKFMAGASAANIRRDTGAFLDFLAGEPDVRPGPVGTTGYCMGGGHALAAAGVYPDRVVAAASYHGGRLATDAPDSVHLLAPKINARVYVAGASEDPSFPDDMKKRLDDALTQAGVVHTIETYPARHGWVPSDTPVHDPGAAERHWSTLFALFVASLKPAPAVR
jgi:carboxymethylenebutenolidase